MTELPDDVDRRTFVKGAATVGVASTGVGAVGGSATPQEQRGNSQVNASALDFTEQATGDTEVNGLINVVVQNVDLTALQTVSVSVGAVNVNVSDIEILNDNVVTVFVNDVVDVTGNQVAVNVLGASEQGDMLFDLTETVKTNL